MMFTFSYDVAPSISLDLDTRAADQQCVLVWVVDMARAAPRLALHTRLRGPSSPPY